MWAIAPNIKKIHRVREYCDVLGPQLEMAHYVKWELPCNTNEIFHSKFLHNKVLRRGNISRISIHLHN